MGCSPDTHGRNDATKMHWNDSSSGGAQISLAGPADYHWDGPVKRAALRRQRNRQSNEWAFVTSMQGDLGFPPMNLSDVMLKKLERHSGLDAADIALLPWLSSQIRELAPGEDFLAQGR